MIDLYTLLVEQLAGGFWISIVMLMTFFLILFAMAGVSFFSVLIFMGVFMFSMGLGYFMPTIIVLMAVAALVYFGMSVMGYVERGGGL